MVTGRKPQLSAKRRGRLGRELPITPRGSKAQYTSTLLPGVGGKASSRARAAPAQGSILQHFIRQPPSERRRSPHQHNPQVLILKSMYHHTNSLYTNNPSFGRNLDCSNQQLMGVMITPHSSVCSRLPKATTDHPWPLASSLIMLPYASLSHFWLATVQEVLQADWQEA